LKIEARKILREGERVEIRTVPSVIALDGEREFAVKEGEKVEARITREGPLVIDYREALREGARNGLFHS
jgi:predicted DNA-binding antitoxin AbrB/MazE fold protein